MCGNAGNDGIPRYEFTQVAHFKGACWVRIPRSLAHAPCGRSVTARVVFRLRAIRSRSPRSARRRTRRDSSWWRGSRIGHGGLNAFLPPTRSQRRIRNGNERRATGGSEGKRCQMDDQAVSCCRRASYGIGLRVKLTLPWSDTRLRLLAGRKLT
jgi:hypothetical protein